MYHVEGLHDFEATIVKTTHNFILLLWLTIDTRYYFSHPPLAFSQQVPTKNPKNFQWSTLHTFLWTPMWHCSLWHLDTDMRVSVSGAGAGHWQVIGWWLFLWRLLPWLWQATLMLFRDENKIYGSFIIQSRCYDTSIVAKLDVGPICKICLYHVYPFYTSIFTPHSLL